MTHDVYGILGALFAGVVLLLLVAAVQQCAADGQAANCAERGEVPLRGWDSRGPTVTCVPRSMAAPQEAP